MSSFWGRLHDSVTIWRKMSPRSFCVEQLGADVLGGSWKFRGRGLVDRGIWRVEGGGLWSHLLSGDCLSPSATCHEMKSLLPPLLLSVNENSEVLNQNKFFLLEVVYNTSFATAMWKRMNMREKEMKLSIWQPAWTKATHAPGIILTRWCLHTGDHWVTKVLTFF